MNLSFVNYLGQGVSTSSSARPKKRRTKETPDEFHKGFRVVGIPPGALAKAEKEHPQTITDAIDYNARLVKNKTGGKSKKVPGPWDPEKWLNEAKPQPVRRKAYEVPDAAEACKDLALKAGWLRVEIVELKAERPTQAQ